MSVKLRIDNPLHSQAKFIEEGIRDAFKSKHRDKRTHIVKEAMLRWCDLYSYGSKHKSEKDYIVKLKKYIKLNY